MTARDLGGVLVAGAAVLLMAVVAMLILAACKPEDGSSGFDRSCKVRGGTPVTVDRDGSKSRICQPPAGGWQ